MAWSHVLLQEDVSDAASRFSVQLSNLVLGSMFQQVLLRLPLSKVFNDLLFLSELRQTFGQGRFRSRRDGG